ncbi:hypothetical protein EDEG_01333 [Edhazardia aedis USNM 41457]|uniref:Helicase C-terminal domain-containing protein n=1 Tax=Edhazardia aedis (strain USNM 41457) TaxID=1003232 RepID=J8ZXP5_EDHAE|nr:hypothetical protein EDEG_01333 [Edhazardia aedis USNM 41457]|eukprot:EJW04463.1 hypothetical protein EDEG_01333 [Edhazardia aedis USNM 41457]
MNDLLKICSHIEYINKSIVDQYVQLSCKNSNLSSNDFNITTNNLYHSSVTKNNFNATIDLNNSNKSDTNRSSNNNQKPCKTITKQVNKGTKKQKVATNQEPEQQSDDILNSDISMLTNIDQDNTSNYSTKVNALFDLIKMLNITKTSQKILIFCQLKQTISFLKADLYQEYPSLKHLTIDGTTKDKSRVAADFNTSTDISILFLTTTAGGVGLNLTSASTVIMFEHDYNPFNDLQAMDRAHRIGQKNTVNIFRLICKDTVEERKMNLQAFKTHVAKSLISQQNSNIESMETTDLLERFVKDTNQDNTINNEDD